MNFNPINKKDELCGMLENKKIEYEIHTSNDKSEEYEYLENGDLCITVINPNYEIYLYIDLEDKGEITLSFADWHSHYGIYEDEFNFLVDDINSILDNKKCSRVIRSGKGWLGSKLINSSEEGKYKEDLDKMPEIFKQEIESMRGSITFYYWNKAYNKEIDL